MSKTHSRYSILLALLLASSVFLRLSISDDMYEPANIAHAVGLTAEQAVEIAIAEVEKREGWRGVGQASGPEGTIWFVMVRRKPGPTNDWRYMDVGHQGKIIQYSVRTDPRE